MWSDVTEATNYKWGDDVRNELRSAWNVNKEGWDVGRSELEVDHSRGTGGRRHVQQGEPSGVDV